MTQNMLMARWAELHECCSCDAQYLCLCPTRAAVEKVRGQGGHLASLQPTKLAPELGIQTVHPGTQLWALALRVWVCFVPQIFNAFLELLWIIQTMNCSGWKSFKNKLFHKDLVTPAFRQAVNPIH